MLETAEELTLDQFGSTPIERVENYIFNKK